MKVWCCINGQRRRSVLKCGGLIVREAKRIHLLQIFQNVFCIVCQHKQTSFSLAFDWFPTQKRCLFPEHAVTSMGNNVALVKQNVQQLIGFRQGNVDGVLSSNNRLFAVHITLREEPFFVFLIEEDKRSLCLYLVKPLKLPRPELLDQSVLFCLVKLVFRVQAFVYSYSDGYKCVSCYKCTTIRPALNTVSRQQATPAQQRSYPYYLCSLFRQLSILSELTPL